MTVRINALQSSYPSKIENGIIHHLYKVEMVLDLDNEWDMVCNILVFAKCEEEANHMGTVWHDYEWPNTKITSLEVIPVMVYEVPHDS